MSPSRRLPKLPDPEDIFSVIDKAGNAIETGLNIIDKVADKFDQAAQKFGPPESTTPATAPVVEKKASPGQKPTATTTQEPETVATACVPCALGHFSCSAGLLNEAIRFKGEGIASNEISDRIAKVLEEQNTLERKDLTPEKLRSTPDWERDLAEEALQQSRSLRHRLETIQTIEELEAAAADTEGYYRKLHREWWKRRFAKLGKAAEPEMTLDEAKQTAADEAAKEVEARWRKEELKDGNSQPY